MNIYISKDSKYNNYFGDPDPKNPKQLSIFYKNCSDDEMQIILNENSEVILIQVKEIIKANYGSFNSENNVDVTNKVKKLLTNKPIIRGVTNKELFDKTNKNMSTTTKNMSTKPNSTTEISSTETSTEDEPILTEKGIKAILWRPSGGLGHCLHNLAWICNKVKDEHCRLYIYGCEYHVPFQEKFNDVISIIDPRVVYEEVKNISDFYKKYNIKEEYKKIVTASDYKTGFKFLNSEKTIGFVCATWANKLNNVISFKKSYIDNVFSNPLKYYKNDYTLINTASLRKIKQFEIIGSYVKALGVTNKHLKITEKDTKYFKVPKTLTIKYKDKNGIIKTDEFKEQTDNKITDISEIILCTYGVLDKIHDVTSKVTTNLCSYEKTQIDSEKQNKQIQSVIASGIFVAVHYRGRDKKTQGGEKKKLKEITQICNKNNIQNVFIATDCPRFYDYICNNTENLTVFRYTNPPPDGLNIHYNTKNFKKGENLFKTILDLYICKKAKYFIPSVGSGFSTLVNEIN